jgi:tRNA dimethylallyltransferase
MEIPHSLSRISHPAETDKPRVIVICGPTAVGKTAIGIKLARALGGEIISADSMQVYRYMDIGTAKPSIAEQSEVRHHLIDVVNPDQPFDAATYATLGRDALAEVIRSGQTPVVVGGSGLYIKALLRGLFRSDGRDPVLRQRLRAELQAVGAAAMHARLRQCDPASAARLHPNDAVRILRAIEVFEVTGQPISHHQDEHGFTDTPFRALMIGLALERGALYRRIDRRVDAMLEAGLEREVRMLLDRGYGPELKSMQSIGYSHMAAFIIGAINLEECLRTLKRDTRRFAKRQMTWFRSYPEIHWTSAEHPEDLLKLAEDFLRAGEIRTGKF